MKGLMVPMLSTPTLTDVVGLFPSMFLNNRLTHEVMHSTFFFKGFVYPIEERFIDD